MRYASGILLLFVLTLGSGLPAATPKAAPSPGSSYLAGELLQQEATPAAPQAPNLAPILLNVVFSLALVLLLVYGVYWTLLRWRARQGPGNGVESVGLIKVLERRLIDGRHSLAVVELGDELVYLGLGDSVSVLARVSDP